MEASTHTQSPTSPPTTDTRQSSKFTKEVTSHDLTPLLSHDYDCTFDIDGGDCKHITIEGVDPTFPDNWDLMPMTLSSSSFFSSSYSDDERSGNDDDEELGWGDSTLQIDSEEARHADAMAKFCTRGRGRSRPQSPRRSWGGVLMFVEALRKRLRGLEGRRRKGRE